MTIIKLIYTLNFGVQKTVKNSPLFYTPMKIIYQLLFKIIHMLTPTYCKKNLNGLGKTDQLIIGIKYWLTSRILD